MKIGRLYIYALISLFANALIFIVEIILNESWQDLVKQTLITLPLSMGFILMVYKIRQWVLKNPLYRVSLSWGPFQKWSLWLGSVGIKAFLVTIPLRWITLLFFDDDGSTLFGLGFWAMCFVSLITMTFVYLMESYMDGQQEKQRIKEELYAYEHEKSLAKYLAIKKQLNPHFLFNSFNSLAGLISTNNKDNAEHFVQELSNVYRYTLENGDNVVVPLRKEITLLNSYMNLQRVRHGTAINLDMDIQMDKMKWLLPPMTLELLIENAIKHNSFDRKKPLNIWLSIIGDKLSVGNTFRPKSSIMENSSLGIGLKSLMNQYDFLTEDKPVFKIENGRYTAYVPLLAPEL